MDLKDLKKEFDNLVLQNKKFEKWENQFNKIINSGNMFYLKIFELINKTPINWDVLWMVSIINNFTLNNDIGNFEYCLTQAITASVVKSFKQDGLIFKIIMNRDEEICFTKLTDFLPELNKDVKDRLQSERRFGHCHWDSIKLSKSLNFDNNVVSGFCSIQSDKMKYPHTWVEFRYQDVEWIIDFTLNAVMNKCGYYRLFNPEKTVSINKVNISEDLLLINNSSFKDSDIRFYLFHPNDVRLLILDERGK